MKATMRRNISRRRAPQRVAATVLLGSAFSLIGSAAVALELGDLRVESTLGQPLRASVGFTLNPNEQMFDFCVRLRQGVAGSPIPSVTRAKVSVVGNRLVFTGDTAIKDPLLNMQVVVDCPYTPQLTRQYTLVVDPVEFRQNEVLSASATVPASAAPVAQSVDTAPAEPASETAATSTDIAPIAVASAGDGSIAANAEYRVQSGDSVSAIAARIGGRTNSLQSAIALLVAANPDAFVNGDAARLMAGSLLTIPPMSEEFGGSAGTAEPGLPNLREYASEPVAADPDPAASVMPSIPVAEPLTDVSETIAADLDTPQRVEDSVPATTADAVPAPTEAATVAEPAVETAATRTSEVPAPTGTGSDDNELRPGDVVVAPVADPPVAETTETDTAIVAAPVASNSASAAQASNDSWTWLTWPVGGALLLLGGILLLGGQIRQKFGSIAVGAAGKSAPPPDTQVDVVAETEQAEQAEPLEDQARQDEMPKPVIDDVDFEFDDTINGEAISLDADLDAGTGLQDAAEMDVAQDFGFSASGQVANEVDHEIPAEAATQPDNPETDIIPPSHREEEPFILESEVTPDDDYDMSMIVDATKQHIDDTQLTVQDLQAVAVDADNSDSYAISDDTLASEADLEALEQDYQEEFTQTQALNQEIEQAAQELAASLDADIEDDDPTGDEPILTVEDPGLDPTAEMPARHPEDELTAEMPARTIDNDVTAEMPAQSSASEVTAELAANVDAQNDDIVDAEVTSKLKASGSEPTVEMQVETVIADLEDDQ